MEDNVSAGPSSPKKRKSHRAVKKKRQRRKSLAAHLEDEARDPSSPEESSNTPREHFYNMRGRNISNTSIETDALLDHREQQQFIRPRRASTLGPSSLRNPPLLSMSQSASKLRALQAGLSDDYGDGDDNDDDNVPDDQTPLLPSEHRIRGSDNAIRSTGFGGKQPVFRSRRGSGSSSQSKRKNLIPPPLAPMEGYNVNYPPSVPGTPPLEKSRDLAMSFGDAMLREELNGSASPRGLGSLDEDIPTGFGARRNTIALQAEEDVCFPQEGLLEMAEDGYLHRIRSRRRRGKWPDLSHLDEWSRLEKIGEERRAKKITEPTLVNGRLRPAPGNKGWYRTEEDTPFRFTYFNEELQSTIHSHTLSELVPQGGSFRELFIPDPPLLSDSSDDEEEEQFVTPFQTQPNNIGSATLQSRQPSLTLHQTASQPGSLRRDVSIPVGGSISKEPATSSSSQRNSGRDTPSEPKSPLSKHKANNSGTLSKPPRYGERPVWWLDVFRPTDEEMKVLSKTFGIHPLTAEDIMVEEAREKVELFRNYYFVNYRTFDQDVESETYLQPINMYVVVFREGVLSFHFALTPHGANVRRRIRQLSDYLTVSSDWISYAIIDDITDVFVPLIHNIEEEVDEIDDAILRLHSSDSEMRDGSGKGDPEKRSIASSSAVSLSGGAGGDMLRRVGDCRKRVMSLYRLLGNKADVIKGFAKRCNEHWEVAPRSDIGLYLGDIQDHIVTMTSNLGHYEKILARSHANYLAQINIRMGERQEQTADVLGKLTVLGTIVLPMNIITGLWGMNVWVPGQEYEGDLQWFVWITAGLVAFGMGCYLIAKRVYGIV